ncbi:MAG: hypothetical protein SCH70_01570 [Candidatus Methanoperedens sp.]|nr:hypothetical protein [Candidatus Methanoperedens sp.]
MTATTKKFQQFAVAQVKAQGVDIERWAKSENPQLAQLCKEIMQAAGAGDKEK